MQYRYEHFSRELLMEDMVWRGGVSPGEEMPDFDLQTTDGDRVRKSDFVGVRPLLQFARELKERDGLPWPVAVDELDGELHRRLDPKPNALYIVDREGRVAFRALWSNDREGVIRKALEDVAAGRAPAGERSGRIVPMMRGIAHWTRCSSSPGRPRGATCGARLRPSTRWRSWQG